MKTSRKLKAWEKKRAEVARHSKHPPTGLYVRGARNRPRRHIPE